MSINYHLKAIYQSAELQPNRTIRKIRIVQAEGSRQQYISDFDQAIKQLKGN